MNDAGRLTSPDDDLRGTASLHATCVAWSGRGVLVLGPSGSGKSGLALDLMAFGARLVADDRTDLRRDGARVIASAPDRLRDRIEARFVGILTAPALAAAPVSLVVDLGVTETQRLPPRRGIKILGEIIPMLHNADNRHFAAAILQYLRSERAM